MHLSLFQKLAVFTITFNLVVALLVLLFQNTLPPVVPLLYGLPVSSAQLAPSLALVIPPLVAAFLGVLNLMTVKATKDKFLEKLLAGLSIAITALAAITVIKIFLLVGHF